VVVVVVVVVMAVGFQFVVVTLTYRVKPSVRKGRMKKETDR